MEDFGKSVLEAYEGDSMRTLRNVVIGFIFIVIVCSVNIVNQVDAQSVQEVEVSEISQIDTHAWAGNVMVQDDIAYVSDFEGLNIFDISDIENPIELSYFNEGVVEPHQIYVEGNFVYLADYTSGCIGVKFESLLRYNASAVDANPIFSVGKPF